MGLYGLSQGSLVAGDRSVVDPVDVVCLGLELQTSNSRPANRRGGNLGTASSGRATTFLIAGAPRCGHAVKELELNTLPNAGGCIQACIPRGADLGVGGW